MTVTREQGRIITAEIMAAIKPILAAHGMDDTAAPRFVYGLAYKFSVETAPMVASDSGVNLASAEAAVYAQVARGSDLDPDAVGKTYTLNGEPHVFVGFSHKAKRYPYLFRRTDGRVFKFSDDVRDKLKMARA